MRIFGRWLKEHCGARASEKRIPTVIMQHRDPAIRCAFLEGLVDGDGYRFSRRGHPWCTVATASKPLMHDLVLLLAQDGLGCSTRTQRQRPRSIEGVPLPPGTLYGVTWNSEGASVTTRFLNGRIIPSTPVRWRPDEVGVWYPIRQPFNGPVFNLSTTSHTYIAQGYLVHNCDAAVNDDLLASDVPLPGGA